MPRPLLARLRPDSIAEFRAAALERFRDGEAAAALDRRTAAVYLWGYAVEMLIKAAYFQVDGFRPRQQITPQDLRNAVKFGSSIAISWPSKGPLHSIRAWGETLVGRRQLFPATTYADLDFEQEVLTRSRRFEPIWSETLRYHPNIAYTHEYRRVHASTGWFLTHSLTL